MLTEDWEKNNTEWALHHPLSPENNNRKQEKLQLLLAAGTARKAFKIFDLLQA